GLQVARGLRVLERPEGVARLRDLDVVRAVVDQLEEQPGLRAALVELPGRVEEARAISEGGRGLRGVADRRAQTVDRTIEALRRLDVAHDRHVVRRLGVQEELPQAL